MRFHTVTTRPLSATTRHLIPAPYTPGRDDGAWGRGGPRTRTRSGGGEHEQGAAQGAVLGAGEADLAREARRPAPGLNCAGASVLVGRYSWSLDAPLCAVSLSSLALAASASLVDHAVCAKASGWSGASSMAWRSIPPVLGGHEASRRLGSPNPDIHGRKSCKTQAISVVDSKEFNK